MDAKTTNETKTTKLTRDDARRVKGLSVSTDLKAGWRKTVIDGSDPLNP